jgi:hypothetical protein
MPRQRTNVTYEIPGGWYGNEAGFLEADPFRGNVTVELEKIADALAWLKRRADIVRVIPERGTAAGVTLDYRLRCRKGA